MVTDGAIHCLEAHVGSLVIALGLLMVPTSPSTERVKSTIGSLESSRKAKSLKEHVFHVWILSLDLTGLLKMLTLCGSNLMRLCPVSAAVARFSETRPEGASPGSVIESESFELSWWSSSIGTNLSRLDSSAIFLVELFFDIVGAKERISLLGPRKADSTSSQR